MKAIGGITFGLLIAFFFLLRADEPVNLAGESPPAPLDAGNAHGRLEITYVSVPPDKLGAFGDAFDPSHAVNDLGDVLKTTGGKVVARASTNLALGDDGAMLEIADSRLTLRPRVASATMFHLEGRITRASFSGSFDVLLTPGMYQLFILWDQPPRGSAKDPYNAVVARMREITLEGPNGDVHTLRAERNPPSVQVPGAGDIPPPPAPLPRTGKIIYENSGDNTKGFAPKSDSPHFTPRNGMLIANDPSSGCTPDASGWMGLPVTVAGNFQIDFDVRADANDAMSWLLLYDPVSFAGVMVCNRTDTSFGDPTLQINYFANTSSTWEIFHDHLPLVRANPVNFKNQVWTHVTITKTGHAITDTVGGQTISADLPANFFPPKLGVGLGYYATKNVGGNGQMQYANLRIIRR